MISTLIDDLEAAIHFIYAPYAVVRNRTIEDHCQPTSTASSLNSKDMDLARASMSDEFYAGDGYPANTLCAWLVAQRAGG